MRGGREESGREGERKNSNVPALPDMVVITWGDGT